MLPYSPALFRGGGLKVGLEKPCAAPKLDLAIAWPRDAKYCGTSIVWTLSSLYSLSRHQIPSAYDCHSCLATCSPRPCQSKAIWETCRLFRATSSGFLSAKSISNLWSCPTFSSSNSSSDLVSRIVESSREPSGRSRTAVSGYCAKVFLSSL